jgi:hypothetical protein
LYVGSDVADCVEKVACGSLCFKQWVKSLIVSIVVCCAVDAAVALPVFAECQ